MVDSPPAQTEFPLIAFNDIRHPTTTNYVVRGLIPREGLVLVYGPPKCGKSFWVMDMVLRVSLNWPYRGRKVKNGNVVYLACEGVSGITARIEAFRNEFLQEDITHVPFYLIPSAIDLIKKHQKLAADIKAHLEENPINIIVIDTLNRSLSGDENKSQDMGDYIKAADYLREFFHCTVIIIHHSGYDATHARGHTSLPAAIDTQIAVSRDKDTNAVIAKIELMKDGEMGDEIRSHLKQVEIGIDDEGDTITSCIVVEDDKKSENPKNKRLTGHILNVFTLLKEIISTSGTYSSNKNIPDYSRCVKYKEAADYCQKGLIAETEAAKRMAFKRSLTDLQKDNFVGIWDDYIWIKTAH